MESELACGAGWPSYLIWIYAGSEFTMMVSYTVLAYLFFVYLQPRHVTVLRKILHTLGWVALLCGGTHGVKGACLLLGASPWIVVPMNVISSVTTIVLLVLMIPMIPAIMRFPTASAMGKANAELRGEISDLLDTNAKLATVDNLRAVENISCAIRAIRELSVSQK